MQSLHKAVALNRPEDVEGLVKNGADVNKRDGGGRTPLDICAITKGIRPPGCMALSTQTSGDCTQQACCSTDQKRLHTAVVLLSCAADPNIADKFGWTIVHTCAWNDDMALLKICVRKGGKVDLPNKENKLPVDLASIKGNTEVVAYLEHQSCNIKALCRRVVRDAMGKQVHRIKELPLPPSLRLFVNHGSPYNGWKATLIPEPPWTVEQLRNTDVTTMQLRDFITDNCSEDFLQESSDCLSEMSDLVDTFQSMYLWEAFRRIGYEEPVARQPRYSMVKVEKKSEKRCIFIVLFMFVWWPCLFVCPFINDRYLLILFSSTVVSAITYLILFGVQ